MEYVVLLGPSVCPGPSPEILASLTSWMFQAHVEEVGFEGRTSLTFPQLLRV